MRRQQGFVTYLRSRKPVMISKGIAANCSRIVDVTQPLLAVRHIIMHKTRRVHQCLHSTVSPKSRLII
jgi:hypothetical protein